MNQIRTKADDYLDGLLSGAKPEEAAVAAFSASEGSIDPVGRRTRADDLLDSMLQPAAPKPVVDPNDVMFVDGIDNRGQGFVDRAVDLVSSGVDRVRGGAALSNAAALGDLAGTVDDSAERLRLAGNELVGRPERIPELIASLDGLQRESFDAAIAAGGDVAGALASVASADADLFAVISGIPLADGLRGRSVDRVAEAALLADRAGKVLPGESMQAFNDAESFGGKLGAFADNPLDIIGEVTARSAAPAVATAAGGVAGGVVGGPVGFAAGTGAASYQVNSAMEFLAAFEAAGVDVGDAGALEAALSDPAVVAEARERAGTRAGVIALFDTLTGGLASKTLAPQAAGALGRELTNMAGQSVAGGVLGASGEALATVAVGDEIDAGEVFLEAVGGLGTAPVDVGAATVAGVREGRSVERGKALAAALREGAEGGTAKDSLVVDDAGEPIADDLSVVADEVAESVLLDVAGREDAFLEYLEAEFELSSADDGSVDAVSAEGVAEFSDAAGRLALLDDDGRDVVLNALLFPEAGGQADAVSSDKPKLRSEGDAPIGFRKLEDGSGRVAKAPQVIIEELGGALGVPIRKGRFAEKARGIFKPFSKVVRLDRANDLETAAHEVGHFLETRFPELADAALAAKAELLPIASSAGAKASQADVLSEGVAEFIRAWVSQPDVAAEVAPGFAAEFERILSADADAMVALLDARDDMNAWFSARPEERVGGYIDRSTPVSRAAGSLVGAFRDPLAAAKGVWHVALTSMFDDLRPIKQAVRDLDAAGELDAASDPYLLARLTRGSAGQVDAFIKNGTFAFNFDERARGVGRGRSLMSILAEVSGREEAFEAYMVAKRAVELHGRDKETMIDLPTAKLTVERGRVEFDETAVALGKFQDEVLQFAIDGGLVSSKSADAIRKANKDYIPFMRVMNDSEFGAGSAQNLVNQDNPIKGISGKSQRLILPPIESVIQNTSMLITATNRNHAAVAMARIARATEGAAKWLEELPAKTKVSNVDVEEIQSRLERAGVSFDDDLVALLGEQMSFFSADARPDAVRDEVTIRIDGEPRVFTGDTRLLMSLEGTPPPEVQSIARLAMYHAKVLRAGIVLDPAFMIKNIIRDTVSAGIQSETGFVPLLDTAKGAKAAFGRNEDYWRYMEFGGGYSSMFSGDETAAARRVERFSRLQGGSEDMVGKIVNSKTKFFELLERVGDSTELGTRVGESTRMFAKMGGDGNAGLSAAYAGREVSTDFALRGRSQTLRYLAQIVPFMNAGIQGTYKTFRAMGDNPALFALRIAPLIAASTGLWFANQGEDWFEEIPEWERRQFWHVKFSDDYIARIPKPFEYGVIGGTMWEILLDEHVAGKDQDAVDELSAAFGAVLFPRMLPPSLLLPSELYGNYSMFRDGQPLVPNGLSQKAPELQFTSGTSAPAKFIGGELGVSPIKIDHAMRGVFGSLGNYSFLAADSAARAFGDLPEAPTPTANQIPFVGTLFTRPVQQHSQFVIDFYDHLAKAREVKSKLDGGLASMGEEAYEEFLASAEAQTYDEMFKRLEGAGRELSALRNEAIDVKQSAELDGDEKREFLDEIAKEKSGVAKAVNAEVVDLERFLLGKK